MLSCLTGQPSPNAEGWCKPAIHISLREGWDRMVARQEASCWSHSSIPNTGVLWLIAPGCVALTAPSNADMRGLAYHIPLTSRLPVSLACWWKNQQSSSQRLWIKLVWTMNSDSHAQSLFFLSLCQTDYFRPLMSWLILSLSKVWVLKAVNTNWLQSQHFIR